MLFKMPDSSEKKRRMNKLNSFGNRLNNRIHKNSIFNVNFKEFDYTRLVSLDKSQFQHPHADFASEGN